MNTKIQNCLRKLAAEDGKISFWDKHKGKVLGATAMPATYALLRLMGVNNTPALLWGLGLGTAGVVGGTAYDKGAEKDRLEKKRKAEIENSPWAKEVYYPLKEKQRQQDEENAIRAELGLRSYRPLALPSIQDILSSAQHQEQ